MFESEKQVLIDHVDRRSHIVSAYVVDEDDTIHRLGHLPGEGWFCGCRRNRRCKYVTYVKQLTPPMEPPK